MNTIQLQQKEKTAQLLWTGLILMFFVIQAVIWTVAISITSSDSSHAVVSGYDEQALNWDEVKRQQSASQALGWDARISVDTAGDIYGNRLVTLSIKDSRHAPVKGATVSLNAFHRAHAAEVRHLEMHPATPGVFTGTLRIQDSGQWRFSGTASLGEHKFLFEHQLDIKSSGNH